MINFACSGPISLMVLMEYISIWNICIIYIWNIYIYGIYPVVLKNHANDISKPFNHIFLPKPLMQCCTI